MLPTPEEALQELKIAEERNPGPWVKHSINTGIAARNIAEKIPGMDAEKAYVVGLLHEKDSITQPHAKDILTWQKYGEKKKISKLNDQLNDQADAIMKTRKQFAYSPEQIKEYTTVGGAHTLDGLYTVFGEISEGMDVVEAISQLPATGKNGRPNPDVKIIRAYVLEENPQE